VVERLLDEIPIDLDLVEIALRAKMFA